jgi:hypothetical protein
MKKTSLSLYCLLLFSITGFSRQKDHELIPGLSPSVYKQDASPDLKYNGSWMINQLTGQALLNKDTGPGKYDRNQLCFPKKTDDNIIFQSLFTDEK